MRQTIHCSSHCCAFAITFRSYLQLLRKDFPEIRAGATTRWMDRGSLIRAPSRSRSPLPYQSRAIVPSRSDIYMAIAGAHLHHRPGCAPRPELKPPHYHGGLWRAAVDRGRLEGAGGCALDEAAAGESVLRILEVMSRAVLYNTRSRPFQSRPLSAYPFRPCPAATVAPLPSPYYEDPDEKWK